MAMFEPHTHTHTSGRILTPEANSSGHLVDLIDCCGATPLVQ